MNYPDNKDHRLHKRYPFVEEILIDGVNKCTSSDISEGGLFVSTIQRFEEGQLIDLIIPMKGEKISLKARVIYCQPGIGAGLAFTDLDDALKGKIRELVGSVMPKSG